MTQPPLDTEESETQASDASPSIKAIKALESYRKKEPLKIVVRFKAVGNAPIMKQNFYKINSTNRFQAVIQFLRKELGWQAGEPLVCTHSCFGRQT
ncbi:Ubiquitin-like protein [Leucoagaricus gongylophorus]